MSPKLLIFDFDGTIAHTLELILAFFNEVAPEYHLPQIAQSDIPTLRNASAAEILQRYPLSPLQLLRLTSHIHSQLKAQIMNASVVDGMPELFSQLKKKDMTVGIVTSNSTENVEIFLQQNGIQDIDFIHSEKNMFGKANVLKKVVRQQKIGNNECLYVGDEVRDIEAAHQAGIGSIAVTWGFNTAARLQQAGPEYIVDKPEEIAAILKLS